MWYILLDDGNRWSGFVNNWHDAVSTAALLRSIGIGAVVLYG